MNYLTDIYSFAILIGVAGAVIAFSIGVYYFVQDKRLIWSWDMLPPLGSHGKASWAG